MVSPSFRRTSTAYLVPVSLAHSRLSQWATRKSPHPAGGKKAASQRDGADGGVFRVVVLDGDLDDADGDGQHHCGLDMLAP